MFSPPPGMSGVPGLLGSHPAADLGWKFPLGVYLSIPFPTGWSQLLVWLALRFPVPSLGLAVPLGRCHTQSPSDPNLCEGQGEQGLCPWQGLGELGSLWVRAPGNRQGGKAGEGTPAGRDWLLQA